MMKKWRMACFSLLTTLGLGYGWFTPSSAQIGFGFGTWGDRFGSWIGVWPWFRGPHSSSYRAKSQRQQTAAVQANGVMEGHVIVRSVCPTAQPGTVCPALPGALDNVTISAEPYGANQWVSARPDAQGRYRLILPPGGYNLRISHPYPDASDQVIRQIIIEPGQTNRQDFQINVPIQ